jgi:hypothetical protein
MLAYDKLGPFFRKRSAILLPFFLAVLLVLPFLGVLCHPTAGILGHPTGDAPASFFFFHDYAARCWLSGQVPLWNPHIMMGTPFLAGGEASVFHPLSAFFLFLPTGLAMNVTIITAFVLGGLAFYGYLRSLELCRTASALGAIVWSFSSVPIARVYAGHLSILLALPAWPFILACWHWYLRDRRLSPLVLLALGYATLILTGHFQSTYIFSIFFLAYVLLHGVGREAHPRYRVGLLACSSCWDSPLAAAAPAVARFRHNSPPANLPTSCVPCRLRFDHAGLPRILRATSGNGRDSLGAPVFWEMWIYIGIFLCSRTVTGFSPRSATTPCPALPAYYSFSWALAGILPFTDCSTTLFHCMTYFGVRAGIAW